MTGFCLAILIIVLLLCKCYLKVPQCLTGLLCCFSRDCCLKKRALARHEDIQTLNVLYQNGENEQARVMLTPSCPAYDMSPIVRTPSIVQTNSAVGKLTPSINSYITDNGICINRIKGCYCAKYGP